METIALPQNVEFKKGTEAHEGLVAVYPCYPGYGITIGNSLRRVLLSSLPGAAVVGVKIKGADHEFMSLPHIKEDVLEIVLNLKRLRLKVFSEEPVKLELDVHGEKKVKASDITKNAQVEIINPELQIANITDMAGNLKMEIYVAQGKGYEPVEAREKKNTEIGYIEIDSIFSPVSNVGVNLENMRVGKMTNWEKLNMAIRTDGTITPEKAFRDATKILISQFNALINKENKEAVKEDAEEKTEAEEETREEAVPETAGEEKEPAKKRGRPKKS
ncbi:MAG: DNA-directed RNA polymerase subunit alpha [Patescibacteria group bacterium]|jgi:DNA-directed RNA polymerase subunit alpha